MASAQKSNAKPSSQSGPVVIGLSAKGLRNITHQVNDFTFVVGPQRYQCPTFVAEFLSPRISESRLIDVTVHELSIPVDDSGGVFGQVLSLGRGCDVPVTHENCDVIERICCELGNSELFEILFPELDAEQSIENVLHRLAFLSSMKCNVSGEIDFISSHFYEITNPIEALKSLQPSVIFEVISNSKLKIATEDLLYDFVASIVEANSELSPLFEFIRFEYVSTSKFIEFYGLILRSFEYLSRSLWQNLGSRLSYPISASTSNGRVFERPPPRGKEFTPSSSSCLNGIVAHLTRECGGNVHTHNVVSVTASSSQYGDVGQIADLQSDASFYTRNSRGSWICYDFKTRKVKVTHYTIRSFHGWGIGSGYAHPMNWVVEGSIDGNSWIELDRRENNHDLNGLNITRTFAMAQSQVIRMIRLRQTGPEHNGTYYLCLSSLEIFGSLID
jgi:hypothetical protein